MSVFEMLSLRAKAILFEAFVEQSNLHILDLRESDSGNSFYYEETQKEFEEWISQASSLEVRKC